MNQISCKSYVGSFLLGVLIFAVALATTMHSISLPVLAAAVNTCDQYGTWNVTPITKNFVVMNNRYGAQTQQCIAGDDAATSWSVTVSNHNNATNGAPASYPAIYSGCHYGNCTQNSSMPKQYSNLGTVTSAWNFNVPTIGAWNAAYDIWFNQTPTAAGQNNGAEIMVWPNSRGVQPAGSKVASNVTIEGTLWDVWFNRFTISGISWNYVAYVRNSPTNSTSFNLKSFFDDSNRRSYLQASWYMTSVQAGFEIWQGGVGLGTQSFNAAIGNPPPPSSVRADFNQDGKSDLLWRNTNGSLAVWTMNGVTSAGGGYIGSTTTDWKVVGTGDFNKDGQADIFWRNDNGSLYVWYMNGLNYLSGSYVGSVTTDWKIASLADFNSDGNIDILWRNDNGALAVWYMNGINYVNVAYIGSTTTDWKIAGSGDFNNNGKPDILWRNDNGSLAVWYLNGINYLGGDYIGYTSTDWKVVAVSDYNSDGRNDLIFENDNGTLGVWYLNGATYSGFTYLNPNQVNTSWKIVAPH